MILDEHRRAMLLALARAPGAEERDDEQVHWVVGGSPAAYFNCVVRANLGDDGPIEAFTSRLRARQIAGTWHLGPTMRPADLRATDLGIVLGTYEPAGPVRHGEM